MHVMQNQSFLNERFQSNTVVVVLVVNRILRSFKKIKLSHSQKIAKIPRLSKVLKLEHIDLEGCTSLVQISSSVRYLDKLVSLNLRDCSRLLTLPVMIHLESLQVLNLSGCSSLFILQITFPKLTFFCISSELFVSVTENAFSIFVPASEVLENLMFDEQVQFEFCPVDTKNEVLDDKYELIQYPYKRIKGAREVNNRKFSNVVTGRSKTQGNARSFTSTLTNTAANI
ncbi:hypothetical protein Bca52824_030901 [Brassica carinata]|uniref:Disease resistance protein n=1 Tax=Brassica carinata TaxID=52824 RepID=A0A8X7V3M9_BRACI|nr:hypothetical protein Bca52824_030901 [Brassica carinata]